MENGALEYSKNVPVFIIPIDSGGSAVVYMRGVNLKTFHAPYFIIRFSNMKNPKNMSILFVRRTLYINIFSLLVSTASLFSGIVLCCFLFRDFQQIAMQSRRSN